MSRSWYVETIDGEVYTYPCLGTRLPVYGSFKPTDPMGEGYWTNFEVELCVNAMTV